LKAWRKAVLVAHVVSSVGWLGAVAAFLVLALVGLSSDDELMVRAAYVAAGPLTTLLIVPMAVASLVTGVVTSMVTPWGLVRHYWVIAKLVLTVLATVVLYVHTHPIAVVARAARGQVAISQDLHDLRVQLVVDAAAAVLVLLVNTVLSIYKPRGLTRRGWRLQGARKVPSTETYSV
jgi:hypothetical protein